MAAKKTTKTADKAVSEMKTADEMKTALLVAQTELVEAKRSHASRELANTGRLKELRVHIARINTALNNPAKSEEKA